MTKSERYTLIAAAATRMQSRKAAEREALAADLSKEQAGMVWRMERLEAREMKFDQRGDF